MRQKQLNDIIVVTSISQEPYDVVQLLTLVLNRLM